MMRWFKLLYSYWLKFAHFIGRINTAILLIIFYLVIMGIAKFVTLIFGKDPLDLKSGDRPSYWRERKNFKAEKAVFLKPY